MGLQMVEDALPCYGKQPCNDATDKNSQQQSTNSKQQQQQLAAINNNN